MCSLLLVKGCGATRVVEVWTISFAIAGFILGLPLSWGFWGLGVQSNVTVLVAIEVYGTHSATGVLFMVWSPTVSGFQLKSVRVWRTWPRSHMLGYWRMLRRTFFQLFFWNSGKWKGFLVTFNNVWFIKVFRSLLSAAEQINHTRFETFFSIFKMSDSRNVVKSVDSSSTVLGIKLKLVCVCRFDKLIITWVTLQPFLIYHDFVFLAVSKMQACSYE